MTGNELSTDEGDTVGEQVTTTTDTTSEENVRKKVERLESLVEQQQEMIEQLQAEQSKDSDGATQNEESEPSGNTATASNDGLATPATRRGVLTAGGVLGLLGLGAGTASADTSGQIGTSSDPLKDLYTENLHGTGGTLTLNDGLDLDGNDLEDAGTTVWDAGNAHVPTGQLQDDSVTVAGNAVSLGGSTGIAHGDLTGVGSDDHHTAHEHPGDRSAEADIDLNSNTLLNTAAIDGSITSSELSQLDGTGLDSSGSTLSVAWGDAAALDSSGDISDFSGATDLDSAGAISSGAVGTSELNTNFADLSTLFGSPVSAGANLDMGGNNLETSGGLINGGGAVTDGDGTERQIWVIANGASDPAGASNEDIIFEEEA